MGSGIRKIWFNLALHWLTCVNLGNLFISKMLICKMMVLILCSCLAHWTVLEIEIIVCKAFRRAHDKLIVIFLVPIVTEATPAYRYCEVTPTGNHLCFTGMCLPLIIQSAPQISSGNSYGNVALLMTKCNLLQCGLHHVLPLLLGALSNAQGPWLETTVTAPGKNAHVQTYNVAFWYS